MIDNPLRNYFERYAGEKTLLRLDEAKAVADKMDHDNEWRWQWTVIDDPTNYELIHNLAFIIKAALTNRPPCSLCKGPMAYLGVDWIDSMPAGLIFGLCAACHELPDRDHRINVSNNLSELRAAGPLQG